MRDKYKELKLYRNLFEERSSKGSFMILDGGAMYPTTRNSTFWGLVSASFIPQEYRNHLNVITPLREYVRPDDASQLSAFFKFQKTPFNVFAEAVGMEIALRFRTSTSFNCPVILPPTETTLYSMVEDKDSDFVMGTLVFSFLNRHQSLHTFASITHKEEPVTNINDSYETIDRFIMDKNPGTFTSEKINEMSVSSKQQLSYQFLERDCFGDVDFSSKNSGLIYDTVDERIFCAPHFDFGETMSILYSSKIKEFIPESLDNYPDKLKQLMAPHIDRINQIKFEKHNAPASLLAELETITDSQKNRETVCKQFPEVAIVFLKDLQSFQQSGELSKIVDKYSGENNLVSAETGAWAVEFLDSRMQVYTQKLTEELTQVMGKEKLDAALALQVDVFSNTPVTAPVVPEPIS